MGIYGEVPGERCRSVLDPYRDSAGAIEASDLDYTILRPGWFTHDEEVNYQITQKGEPFKGHDVSLNSLSDLIVKLALSPGMEVRRSLGVSRAGRNCLPGAKPAKASRGSSPARQRSGHRAPFTLHMIPQHQLLRIRPQVHLLPHPLRHRMPPQVVLEQGEWHDQRHQLVPVVFDQPQQLLLVLAR